ncbi:MAG: polyphosphate kinase 2 family protein [Actinomycetota bacterium]|jgi:PPK2 family polyphosphate:nucleotide phosphotransferase
MASTTLTPEWQRTIEQLRVKPGEKVKLAKMATKSRFDLGKSEALDELDATKARLDLLQQRLFAEHKRSVLLVLQAMDAAGKDGTIRAVFSGLNPAGVSVASFKAPSSTELAHDYLWRIHAVAPERGNIGVFNRSHYEDVVTVRVKQLVPDPVWKRRFGHIRNLEQLLTDEGTTVVKCFLHVSKVEQAVRLQARLDDPEKRWKFRAGDLDDRALWPKFQKAFDDALSETSTAAAPWYVVPADSNSGRNLAVAKILLQTLERLDPQIPPADPGLEKITIV